MATLANLVKNIDPPVEITQEEYNNLTEEQKNDGTVYYIVDGSSSFQTAATTPAEASDGTGSNVQTELDKRLEISKLVNGGTATEAGYALDARYGKTLTDIINNNNNIAIKRNTVTITDMNDLPSQSVVWVNGNSGSVSNLPFSVNGTYHVLTVDTVSSGTHGYQIAYRYTGSDIYIRTKENSVWKDWIPVRRQPVTILDQRNIPQTATSYNCSLGWTNFSELIIQTRYYDNVISSIIIPVPQFSGTTVGTRIWAINTLHDKTYEVYKNTNSSVYLKASQADDEKYGITIYGI